MLTFFDYQDYKVLINSTIEAMPRRGRGQFRKLSEKLRVNSTAISQIFKGSRDLTPEQALEVCDYFGFNQAQERFFIVLVQKARAGTKALEEYYQQEEKRLRDKAQAVKARVLKHEEIKEKHKAKFYSDWYYSGIRLLSSVPEYNTVDDFAEYFNISRGLANHVIEFLVETGLCVQDEKGLRMGPSHTFVGNKSPMINSHRRNWRLKALYEMQKNNQDDLFVSIPVSLSKEDRKIIREELVQTVSKFMNRIKSSSEEQVACLNIDWFDF